MRVPLQPSEASVDRLVGGGGGLVLLLDDWWRAMRTDAVKRRFNSDIERYKGGECYNREG